MSMPWIKWEHGLCKKEEILRIATILGLHRRFVAATCMEFWEWADRQTEDGRIACPFSRNGSCARCEKRNKCYADGVTQSSANRNASQPMCDAQATMIDSVVDVTGFAEAMRSVGWIDINDGNILVANWCRHNSKSSRARDLSARRMNEMRKRNDAREEIADENHQSRNIGNSVTNVTPTALPSEIRDQSQIVSASSTNTHQSALSALKRRGGGSKFTAEMAERRRAAAEKKAAARLSDKGTSIDELAKQHPSIQASTLMSVLGCDASMIGAVRRRISNSPDKLPIVWGVFVKFHATRAKIDNVGAWTRVALTNDGLDLTTTGDDSEQSD